MTARECHDLAHEIEQKFEGVECWYDPISNTFKLATEEQRPIQIPVPYYQAMWGFATLIQPD